MASISRAVAAIKPEPDRFISPAMVERVCREAGHRWRERVLTPLVTLRLFLLQVLHGNIACRAVRQLSKFDFTDSSYCDARARLPLDLLGLLCAEVIAAARERLGSSGLWHGHRTWLVDGSGVSMPDMPALRKVFGVPGNTKPGCGFPVMHVLMLFDAYAGFIIDFAINRCHTHDMKDAAKLHPSLAEGDVLVGDRAFGTFAHFALLLQQNLHGVCRLHQKRDDSATRRRKRRKRRRKRRAKRPPTMRLVRKLGHNDALVELSKPKQRPRWMTAEDFAALPPTLTLRLVRYHVRERDHRTRIVTVLTTLLDPRKYPRKDIAQLYHRRWCAEVNLRHLKHTMKMNVLRCKTEDGVMRELWMYVITYNLVRRVMLDEAEQRGLDIDRISFIDALDAIRFGSEAPLATHPHRPGRFEPRVIKRKKDGYAYLTRPRDELRQLQLSASSALVA